MNRHDPQRLIEANRAAFAAEQPALWRLLKDLRPSHSELVVEDGRAANIRVGDTPLYPEPVWKAVAKQFAAFAEAPDQVAFPDDRHCCVSPVSEALRDDLVGYLDTEGTSIAPKPVTRPMFAFVFGLGLGLHVAELVARDAAAAIVVFEPVAEFLVHSLSAVDWAAVFATARRQGNRIHFVLAGDGAGVAGAVQDLLQRGASALFLEGSLYYGHYDSETLTAVKRLVIDILSPRFTSTGFFEDEIKMMRNTHANLRDRAFRLVAHMPRRTSTVPVFIVGSGPSIDRDLPRIRELRDKAIIVSASSALQVLLKNGIRPHLHFESENKEEMYPLLQNAAAQYDLSGIRFACSATMTPAATGMFPDRWFVFREVLSASMVFGTPSTVIAASSPMSANVAFAALAALGFKRFYLFGIDCGMRRGDPHHSPDSFYFDAAVQGRDLYVLHTQIDQPVPGNFGGTFHSNFAYVVSRRSFSRAIATYGLSVVNCSDGALIEGAKPMRSAAIALDGPSGGQEAALAAAETAMERFEAGAYLERHPARPTETECDAFTHALRAFVGERAGTWPDLTAMADDLLGFLRDNLAAYKGVIMVLSGSMTAMIRLADYHRSRIADPTRRMAFQAFFLERYVAACAAMAERCKTLFAPEGG